MIIGDFLSGAIGRLKAVGIESAALDARLLACHILGIDRAQLLSQNHRVLNDQEKKSIDALLARRERHESVARIIGHREFWGLDFGLNEATLEPRPDSEILIEAVLNIGRQKKTILDLGTGSGCLLLSLLHEMPNAQGLGIDLAPRAVEQATKNAAALGLEPRARFRVGDWLQGITEKFDIIISNPPYIATQDVENLMPEVKNYDPRAALDGGADGLDPYRILIPQLPRFLNDNGIVAFETGQGQAQQVAQLLQAEGFAQIMIHKDLGGIERCVTASKSTGSRLSPG